MKYTIEIPTIEALETLTATAHHKAQAWMLEKISAEVENEATIGNEEYTLELGDCPYKADQFDVNEVQNALREMGYMTTYRPRKNELTVEWSEPARYELQNMKDNNVCWTLITREQHKKNEEEFFQKYGWTPGRK
jgi:hypothetical protein